MRTITQDDLQDGFRHFIIDEAGFTKIQVKENESKSAAHFLRKLSERLNEASGILEKSAQDICSDTCEAKIISIDCKIEQVVFLVETESSQATLYCDFSHTQKVTAAICKGGHNVGRLTSLFDIVNFSGISAQYILGVRDAIRKFHRHHANDFRELGEIRDIESLRGGLQRHVQLLNSQLEEAAQRERHGTIALARSNAECRQSLSQVKGSTKLAFDAGGEWLGEVYFLVLSDEIVYVGQAKNGVRTRLPQHVKDKTFDSVYVLPCLRKDLDATERAYIARFKPRYNISHKPIAEAVA